ncbi:heterokaryon incompatibility protein-domain-containing protein [Cercophora newfieldiana]|uniref:Heterokaryon incompatibility protein-domain-containing protein n=1 Tax=Cercophora newfieldiana TaxID=92897 RepID=A0AA39Y0Y7_9PEZI|nr:heterokaryon incompatibility protein-domain-containing protein [Cercophora newfieldiana]
MCLCRPQVVLELRLWSDKLPADTSEPDDTSPDIPSPQCKIGLALLKKWSANNMDSINKAKEKDAQVFGGHADISWPTAFLPFTESTAMYLRDWGFLLEAWKRYRVYKSHNRLDEVELAAILLQMQATDATPGGGNPLKRKATDSEDGCGDQAAPPSQNQKTLESDCTLQNLSWETDREKRDTADDDSVKTGPGATQSPLLADYPAGRFECCDMCKAMTGTPEGLYALLSESGYEHFNWYEIQNSLSNCALCASIWEATEYEDWESGPQGITREPIRVFAARENEPVAGLAAGEEQPLSGIQLRSLIVMIPGDTRTVTGEELHLVTSETKYISGRLGSKDLSATEVKAIHTWLKAEGIRGRGDSPPDLPRRVIEEGERAEYAALSYCWGAGAQQVTTTSSNITDHVTALPNGLGRTILDAIHVCRKIGIRFLWVDALCIIQDDDDDKLDQIARMGSLYKCSTLTIVAACAEKVTDGFLRTDFLEREASQSMPRPESLPRLKLPVFINESTFGTTYLRLENLDTTYAPEEPVFKRGWTFQELMLSPRALIFDSRHITLKSPGSAFKPLVETHVPFQTECPELPAAVFDKMDEKSDFHTSKKKSNIRRLAYEQYRIWSQVIEEYSGRNFTFFTDRLPALAGLASELARVWDDIYLAGLWRRTLIQHLAWHMSSHGSQRWNGLSKDANRTKRSGCPSWSWVAVPYPITFSSMMSRSVDAKLSRAHGSLSMHVYIPDGIKLDFVEEPLDLENCWFLYLGGADNQGDQFLIVEKFETGTSRRVGQFTTLKSTP